MSTLWVGQGGDSLEQTCNEDNRECYMREQEKVITLDSKVDGRGYMDETHGDNGLDDGCLVRLPNNGQGMDLHIPLRPSASSVRSRMRSSSCLAG